MTPSLWVLTWFHRELRPRRGEPGYTTTTGWTRGRRALLAEHEALVAFDDHLAAAREFADEPYDLRCSHVELLRVVPAERPLLELLAAALEAPFDHHLDRGAWWGELHLVRSWYGVTDPAARTAP